MWQPKRVWSNNKTVWDGKKSVWLQDWELKTYDGNWEDAGSDLQTYWSQWEEVSDDAILDVYDSNTPEPIWTPEDWIKATYTFKDYDGTVLKTGTVDDWWTPVAPTDPTREATAQYTYTFAGWSPAVWPIAKNTVYTATYTSTVNTYTVTIVTNDATYGTVSPASVTAPYGTSISALNNALTIGETTVTATAESGYAFSSWGTLPETVTENLTITATFEAESYTFTINVENLPEGAFIDNGEEPLEDFPIILDIPSWWSFNGVCDSHEGDGDLNVTIYDTPDWSGGWVVNELNIACDWYKPSFEAVWFDLEDVGGWTYNFKKDDDYQIVPDSNVSLTISFTPVEEPAE